MQQDFEDRAAFMGELENLTRFATHYDKLLRPQNERDLDIQKALERLNALEITTAYPFLLGIFDKYHNKVIDRSVILEVLRILENYMIRRYLAGEQSNYTNRMFPTLERELDPNRLVESLRKVLIRKNYPSDNRIKEKLLTDNLYNKQTPQRLFILLNTINRYLSTGTDGYTTLNSEPTIEHIMPQQMNDEWRNHIGSEWATVHRDYLHTLGNLTLVTQGWNSSLSNGSFYDKKQKFTQHALLLNKEYFSDKQITTWDEKAIRNRTEYLTNLILSIWQPFGDLPDTLDVTGRQPKTLWVLGDKREVNSWRDVIVQMAEIAITLAPNTKLLIELPSYFSTEQKARSRQLSNGMWVSINFSGTSAIIFCERVISTLGGTQDDWRIDLEPVI